MTKNELYSNADLLGRLQVIYTLQMIDPDLQITSMPISSRYDLEVYNPKRDTTQFMEIKDRDCQESTYDSAILNIEKFEALSGYGESFWYVNLYRDGKIDFWQPTKVPTSGITQGEYYIRRSTVENSRRLKQKRYLLNFNDKSLQLQNKIKNIELYDQQ